MPVMVEPPTRHVPAVAQVPAEILRSSIRTVRKCVCQGVPVMKACISLKETSLHVLMKLSAHVTTSIPLSPSSTLVKSLQETVLLGEIWKHSISVFVYMY